MVTMVECRVPTEQFALARTFLLCSELRVEVERFVAQDAGSAMPFVWVTTDDFEAFEAALVEDPSVETFSMLTELEDERLYRMNWVQEVELMVQFLLDERSAVVSARTDGGSWRLRVMCPDRDSLSRTYECCEENGLSLTIDSIYELDEERSEFGLTRSQYETLRLAKRLGYYDVPRTVTLTELANELDISHQALSERLRRAHANLIDRTISSTAGRSDRPRPDLLN